MKMLEGESRSRGREVIKSRTRERKRKKGIVAESGTFMERILVDSIHQGSPSVARHRVVVKNVYKKLSNLRFVGSCR